MSDSNDGWIGVDLDGTLAVYDGWRGRTHIGEPVTNMLQRVKRWLREGKQIKIFTARVAPSTLEHNEAELEETKQAIEDWCIKHIGQKLEITHEKDFGMVELWDDRCVQVEKNTGVAMFSASDELVKKLTTVAICYLAWHGVVDDPFKGLEKDLTVNYLDLVQAFNLIRHRAETGTTNEIG